MERSQGSLEIPEFYPRIPSIPYAYPPPQVCDTIAANYAHSLTTTPYNYFIPHYNYAPRYPYPHSGFTYTTPFQLGITRATSTPIPHLGAPPTSLVPYRSTTLKTQNADNPLQLQEIIDSSLQQQKVDEKPGEEKPEETIDPRIIHILEPFRHLYSEHEDTLKSIFPGVYSKLSEFFNKVNSLILEAVQADGENSKPRTLKRSLSFGDSSSCMNEWFKVKPIDSDDVVVFPPEDTKGGGVQ